MAQPDIRKEVVIIGGGPGGLSALLWCARLGLDVVLLERENRLGGQLTSIHNPIIDVLGSEAPNGALFLNRISNQVSKLHSKILLDSKVTCISIDKMTAGLEDQAVFNFETLILAGGVSRRKLGLTGETELRGNGIMTSGSLEKKSVNGMRVAIVGGGDAAFENALILSEFANEVNIVHRSSKFRARPEFVFAVSKRSNIKFIVDTEIEAICGKKKLRSIVLKDRLSGAASNLAVDALLVRIGVTPNTDLVAEQLKIDKQGYIQIDSSCETSQPGIYAVGDIANPTSPTISTAIGNGATVAKHIFAKLNSNRAET
jgi:thioredoxin reductase (NADPH)